MAAHNTALGLRLGCFGAYILAVEIFSVQGNGVKGWSLLHELVTNKGVSLKLFGFGGPA